MPKFPSIPQLSIVVPVSRNLSAFERTLISVLENRPNHCEVLVTHDGSYEDPYCLADEVRFVTSSRTDLPELIAVGAQAARGRLVHVLSGGLQATCGWTDDAVEQFDHFDCGSVAPVIRHSESQQILAAGWTDAPGRLLAPRTETGSNSERRSRSGCYLQASFWRRDLLRSLGKSFSGTCADQACDVYQRLARQAGWTCDLAAESTLLCDDPELSWTRPSFKRGRQLRAVSNHFGGNRVAALMGVLSNLIRPAHLLESLGGLVAGDLSASIDASQVLSSEDEGTIMQMPSKTSVGYARKAA